MSVSKISKGLLLGLALLLATSVFAINKGSLQVSDAVVVSGKQLPALPEAKRWDFLRGKNVVATVPARMVDLQRTADRDSAEVTVNGNGQKALNEIRFSGKKYALAINAESAKVESGATSK